MIKYMQKSYKWLDIFLEIGKMKLYKYRNKIVLKNRFICEVEISSNEKVTALYTTRKYSGVSGSIIGY